MLHGLLLPPLLRRAHRCNCSNNCCGVLTPGGCCWVDPSGWLRWWRRRSLDGFRFVVAVVGIGVGIGLRRRRGSLNSSPRGGAENQFSRRAVAQVAKQNLVVGSSNQQIGEHIAWSPRSEVAEHPLVTAQSLDFHTAVAGHLTQNGGEAGIIRANRESVVGEDDLCIPRWLLQQGRRNLSSTGVLQAAERLPVGRREPMASRVPRAPAPELRARRRGILDHASGRLRSTRTSSTGAGLSIRRS